MRQTCLYFYDNPVADIAASLETGAWRVRDYRREQLICGSASVSRGNGRGMAGSTPTHEFPSRRQYIATIESTGPEDRLSR
jgi:hypothetical protein